MESKISNNFNPDRMHADDLVMVESFLRAAREILDGSLEEYSLDQVRGAMMLLEKYIGLREVLNDRRLPKE